MLEFPYHRTATKLKIVNYKKFDAVSQLIGAVETL